MDGELKQALDVLSRAGVAIVAPGAGRCLSAKSVAFMLDMKADWVREHLAEFPGWFRLPGGGRNGGEIRIPEKAVEDFKQRRQSVCNNAGK